MSARKRGAKPPQPPQSDALQVAAPEMPEVPEAEYQVDESLLERLREAIKRQHQHNRDNAVLLAQMAARGHGPLVDYFGELGRRYAHSAEGAPKAQLSGG